MLARISKACGSGKKPEMHQMALWLGSVGMSAPRRPQGSGFQGITEGSLGVSTLSLSLPACTILIFLRSPLSDFFPITLLTPSSLHTCFFLPPPSLLVPLPSPTPYLFPSPPCSSPSLLVYSSYFSSLLLPPPSSFLPPPLPPHFFLPLSPCSSSHFSLCLFFLVFGLSLCLFTVLFLLSFPPTP